MSAWIRRGISAACAVGFGSYGAHRQGWIEPAAAWCHKAVTGPFVSVGASARADLPVADVVGENKASSKITIKPARQIRGEVAAAMISNGRVSGGISVPPSAWGNRNDGPVITSAPSISSEASSFPSGSPLFPNSALSSPFSESFSNNSFRKPELLPPRVVNQVPIRLRGRMISNIVRH